MTALAQILACPACALGGSGDALAGALLLGGMILAPIGVTLVVVPSIIRIVGGKRSR